MEDGIRNKPMKKTQQKRIRKEKLIKKTQPKRRRREKLLEQEATTTLQMYVTPCRERFEDIRRMVGPQLTNQDLLRKLLAQIHAQLTSTLPKDNPKEEETPLSVLHLTDYQMTVFDKIIEIYGTVENEPLMTYSEALSLIIDQRENLRKEVIQNEEDTKKAVERDCPIHNRQ